MSKALECAYEAALDWIEGLDERPVWARATLQDLATAFRYPLPEVGSRPEEVIAWLTENATGGMLGSASGRFFAWVIGGAVESALAADWSVFRDGCEGKVVWFELSLEDRPASSPPPA